MDGVVIAAAAELDPNDGSGYTYIMYDDGAVSFYSWTGGGALDDWSDPNNWDNGVPDNTVDCVIPEIPAAGPGLWPSLVRGGDCANLTIDRGAEFRIIDPSATVFVSGNFTNDGYVEIMDGKLDILVMHH